MRVACTSTQIGNCDALALSRITTGGDAGTGHTG